MSRFLNFYPEIIATFVLAAGTTAPGPSNPSCGVYSCSGYHDLPLRGCRFELDLVFTPLCWGASRCHWHGLMEALTSIHCVDWSGFMLWLGSSKWSYHELATSLERQIDVRPLFAAFDGQQFSPPYSVPSNFVWEEVN